MTTPSTPSFQTSSEEMALLLPWMRAQLTNQPKADENSDLCQVLTRILRRAHEEFGTEPPTRETCICYG
ncbi:hypothetical protein OV450_1386 [Actinobacteria bacterium OV450]|nr:hypothetical protein OV450_1386 [Actinobacteria bacterium OV450]